MDRDGTDDPVRGSTGQRGPVWECRGGFLRSCPRRCSSRRAYHRAVSGEDLSTRSELKRCPREPLLRSHAWLFNVLSYETPMTAHAAGYELDDVDLVVLGRGSRAAVRQVDDGCVRLQLSLPDQWMSIRHAHIERRIGAF